MRPLIVVLACLTLGSSLSSSAFAQPALSATPIEVLPGGTVTATVTGSPGQAWGLGGSYSGSGLVFGGLNLALGTDAVALGYGVLDGTGTATVTFKPPIGPN